jgi:predicted aconitase
MKLTDEERDMLEGGQGRAVRKAMEILAALGTIYGAEQMLEVTSVQVAGVSYDNLGEAGLQFLDEMAEGGGRARVLTTLNPAGMDVENWQALGISAEFAARQQRVIEAFERMGITPTCTCTPYLAGNTPGMGEHIAWAESSAVCYANSVLGARSNREGGPSALAAALTGRTPAYGYHLDEQRRPSLTVEVEAQLSGSFAFGALGRAVGEKLEAAGAQKASFLRATEGSGDSHLQGDCHLVPFLRGVEQASLEELKALCASLATYGGAAMFHMEGITPEAGSYAPPGERLRVTQTDLDAAGEAMNDAASEEVDFVSLGCPHLSLAEVARIAELLQGRRVVKEFWITTARPTKQAADWLGYTRVIEESGAKFAVDTCCVVAPIRGRFHALATDSAKACYYAYAKNQLKTVFKPFDEVVLEALGGGTEA